MHTCLKKKMIGIVGSCNKRILKWKLVNTTCCWLLLLIVFLTFEKILLPFSKSLAEALMCQEMMQIR